jgi:transcriptional regulator with XRE-family HTH domain
MKKGALLRQRRRLGMTQAELADLIGVAPNTVARWERDELPMRDTTERLVTMVIEQELKTKARKRRKR